MRSLRASSTDSKRKMSQLIFHELTLDSELNYANSLTLK